MANAYIPALAQMRAIKLARIRRERLLPSRGAVVVQVGNRVGALDIIAKSNAMGHLRSIPLARYLKTNEATLPKYLVKKPGEDIQARDIIAAKPEFFGTMRRVFRAPGAGRVAALYGAWLTVELMDTPFELKALYRGTVRDVMPRLGAVIEATGALVQGVWGAGGEGFGVLQKMVDAPDAVLGEEKIDVAARNTVILAGAGITETALRRAAQEHVAGVIVGSLQPRLRALVQELGLATIATEGLGERPMATPIFELLASLTGNETVLNVPGVKRGAARPEVFIPILMPSNTPDAASPLPTLLAEVSAPVRVVAGTHAGELGKIGEVPDRPRALDSGALAWGAEIELASGGRTFVPWENLELIG